MMYFEFQWCILNFNDVFWISVYSLLLLPDSIIKTIRNLARSTVLAPFIIILVSLIMEANFPTTTDWERFVKVKSYRRESPFAKLRYYILRICSDTWILTRRIMINLLTTAEPGWILSRRKCFGAHLPYEQSIFYCKIRNKDALIIDETDDLPPKPEPRDDDVDTTSNQTTSSRLKLRVCGRYIVLLNCNLNKIILLKMPIISVKNTHSWRLAAGPCVLETRLAATDFRKADRHI